MFIPRYFPYRQRDYEQEIYYPYRGVYARSNRDDFYDNRYLEKYRNGFDNRYHQIWSLILQGTDVNSND